MFSKTSSKTPTTPTSTTMAKDSKTSLKTAVPSIISADMKIVGSIDSSGDIQIDGVIEGDVTSRTVTVSDTATVRGSIAAETLRVAGTVKGGLTAKSVTLTRTARVEGDIIHQALAIESGANFEGQCRRLDGNGRAEQQKIALIVDANAGERRHDAAADRSHHAD
jgi:cytoskeletal protein CcmA (bactofilin family)